MLKEWEVEQAMHLIAWVNLMRIKMENWFYNATQNPSNLQINGEELSTNRGIWSI